jgi:hypothetical protein
MIYSQTRKAPKAEVANSAKGPSGFKRLGVGVGDRFDLGIHVYAAELGGLFEVEGE